MPRTEENPGAEAKMLHTTTAQEAFGASSVNDQANAPAGAGADGHEAKVQQVETVMGGEAP